MQVGELFLSLGIKGTDQVLDSFVKIEKGMDDVSSVTLETKAAILGAAYALERLFDASGQRGTELTNVSTILGLNAKTLQEYQYAARQVGATNEEVTSSFEGLQKSMTDVLMGKGAAKESMAYIQQTLGHAFSNQEVQEFQNHPEKLFQMLQEYAQKEQNAGLRHNVLSGMGISDNLQAGMVKGVFNEQTFKKAPVYSDKEIESLNKANIAWKNLGSEIQMAIGRINSEFGGRLVSDIAGITKAVLLLTEAFLKLARASHLLSGLKHLVEGLGSILNTMTSMVNSIVESFSELKKIFNGDRPFTGKETKEDLAETKEKARKEFSDSGATKIFDFIKDLVGDFVAPSKKEKDPVGSVVGPSKNQNDHVTNNNVTNIDTINDHKPSPALRSPLNPNAAPGAPMIPPKILAPNVTPPVKAGANNNFNMNQSLNFSHPGTDSKTTAMDVKRAVQGYFNSNYTLSQVT